MIVWDNGIGIAPEKAQQILTDNSSEFFKEVGIANVQKRLQYEFGAQYGIHVESELNQYTKMHLIIPKTISADVDVDSNSSI